MAFKEGVVLGTVSFNATGSGTTAIGATSNSGTIAIGNTSSAAITIDCGTAGITVGTTANAHSSTFGSTNSTSATTVQSGSGALNVTSTNGALSINSGTGTLGISTDASATTVNFATGGAVKGVTLGSTNSTSATTVQSGSGALNITSTNGALTINSGTGALGISTDASATTISIGTGAAVKAVTLGSINSTSTMTLQSGTGGMVIQATNTVLNMTSGTGTMGIGIDATAQAINIGTGAAAKSVTLGSTNSTSQTTIQSGSGNIIANSGFTVDSSGRNKNAVQPCFLISSTGTTNNTGDGTAYTVVFATTNFDQGSNISSNTTFTAPVTGKYLLSVNIVGNNFGALHSSNQIQIVTTAKTFQGSFASPGACRDASNQYSSAYSVIANMSATNTATIVFVVSGSTKTVGVANGASYFSGMLVA